VWGGGGGGERVRKILYRRLILRTRLSNSYALGLNDFDSDNIYYKGHWKGWALKIKTFFGPGMATNEASIFKIITFHAI
jgi:hypothetical protein